MEEKRKEQIREVRRIKGEKRNSPDGSSGDKPHENGVHELERSRSIVCGQKPYREERWTAQ